MKIHVNGGTASLRAPIPIFIGTTADLKDCGHFPKEGELYNFVFQPKKGDTGVLVFDQPAEEDRRLDSALLFHFWWQDNKLIVEKGIKPRLLKKSYRLEHLKGLGYTHIIDDGHKLRVYHTHSRGEEAGIPSSMVSIVDLFFLLEGKIDYAELDKRVLR